MEELKSDLDFIPLLIPDMPSVSELMPWMERIDDKKYYTNFGPLVRELELRFSEKFCVGVDNVTTVANATLGLELTLRALHLPKNANILIPAFTFVATATAVLRAGYRPVLADVDMDSWLLTPEIARAACTQVQIDAVIPVATFGMPHNMQDWLQFEEETGVPVVIDAAAAYGSQWLENTQGTLVFSLHATKSLPAGEGGLVVSTRPDLVAEVRQLSNFGINLQHGGVFPIGALAGIGTNAKMSEYHAAIALASLQRWERSAQMRRELQVKMVQCLDHASGHTFVWQQPSSGGRLQAPTLLCALFPNAATRYAVERACQRARIMTRRWYQPLLTEMGALQQHSIFLDIPNATVLGKGLLGFPFFLGITQAQISRIESVISPS